MVRALPTLVVLSLGLVGCKGKDACGLSLSDGPEDPDADIVVLGDRYGGPAFSELGDLEVRDDIVWFCSSVIGLNAYDASNPERLKKLDDLGFSDGDLLFPRCHHLALGDAGRIYVTQRANSISDANFIATVDASDPSDLVEVATQTRVENVEGLTVHGDQVLVAAHEAGLLVLERQPHGGLLDRGQLTEGLANPWQVRARDDLAYVANGEGGLAIVDVSNPSAPTLRSTLEVGGVVKDLELDGDRAYLAAGASGVAVVDISDPDAPMLLQVVDTPGSALALALGRDAVFVSDWNDLRIFDRSDPDALRLRGHEPLTLSPGVDSRTLGVAADGDWLYSGNWTELVSYQHFPGREAPDLTARPGFLQLGSVEAGETGDTLLTLDNAGSEPVELTEIKTSTKQLAVDNLPDGPLAPGASHTVQVRFTPKNDRAFEGWLNLFSDDPDQPKQCVRAEGNQAGLAIGDVVEDRTFVGLDGEVIRLDDHEGKAVVLAYFATF